jgi:hypothetical protein
MKAISLCFSLACLVMVGCIGDPAIDTDEAELAAPDAGVEGGIATSPSYVLPLPPRGGCTLADPCPPTPVAPNGAVASIDNDWDFCRIYPRWCDDEPSPPTIPPPPSSPDPGPYPCHLYPPGQCPADPPKPPLAPEPTVAEVRAAAIEYWASETGTEQAWSIAGEAWALAEQGIVAPCPPDMPPSYCDPEGGGGSGTGGGTGGGGGGTGGGGSGGGTPSCIWGWHWEDNGCGGLGCCQPNGPQPGDSCPRPPTTPPSPTGEICTRNNQLVCVCTPLPPPVAPTESEVLSLLSLSEEWEPGPPQGIIQPGCDAPPTDPYRVCEGDGGGGSGTGGGSGGGGTGGGSGSGFPCPPFHDRVNGQCVPSCLAGYHWSSLYGQCIHDQTGQECMPPGWQDMTHADHCYWTTAGVCATYLNGGDCRCDYGYIRGGMEYGGEVYGQCYRPPT